MAEEIGRIVKREKEGEQKTRTVVEGDKKGGGVLYIIAAPAACSPAQQRYNGTTVLWLWPARTARAEYPSSDSTYKVVPARTMGQVRSTVQATSKS